MSAPVDWDPLVARVPAQLPEAAQEVALVEVQVSVAALPDKTFVGFTVSVTVGPAAVVTVTFADCEVVPPAPVQVRV